MTAFLRALVVPVSVLVCLFLLPSRSSAQSNISLTQTFCLSGTPCVWTYHNDNNRAGVNPNETVFSPTTNFANLTPTTYATDGLVYAQPLYVKGLNGSNQKVGICPSPANIVFV